MSDPMSDERLLDLKQMCANAHHTGILVAPLLMGEALDEIDRLKLGLKLTVAACDQAREQRDALGRKLEVGDNLRGSSWQILRERVAAARGECADPEHTDSIDDLLAFIDGTGWAEPAHLDEHREGFLRQATILLGAEPQHWRERLPGEVETRPRVSDRPVHECATRALALWNAYVALDRTGAR